MMTLRAGRRAVQLSFAALLGVAGQALPAAAQSYLADTNNSSVTVDYSVLGQAGPAGAPGVVTRTPLPMGATPAGVCNCGAAPLGVIASAPQPTFNSPYGNAQVMQAPAVPPGFLTYAQAVGAGGASGSGQRVVLRAPGGTPSASMAAAPSQEGITSASSAASTPLPPTTETANEAPAGTSASLSATTPTQTANAGEASTGGETGTATPPSQPENMPQSVPSPVEQPPAAENAAPAQPTEAPAAQNAPAPAESTPANPPASGDAATTATPPAATADNNAAQPAPAGNEQQAAVTPPAPANAPASAGSNAGGAALPAGATRIVYTSDADDVPGNATAELDKIAQQMQANENMRVQVMAYAAGTEDTESKARRKSLARGLAVRSYLIKAGVRSTRIDVRALGSKAEGGPADRVDIIPAS